MPQGTRKEIDPYIHCEFVYITCTKCGKNSNDFMYKEHLNAEETIVYIEQITGFVEREDSNMRAFAMVNNGENADKGGVICPTCQNTENKVEEVANG